MIFAKRCVFSLFLFSSIICSAMDVDSAMDGEKCEISWVAVRCVLDPSQGECRAESSDRVWRVQTSKHGELLCKKNSRGYFEVQSVLTEFKTRMILPIKSKSSDRLKSRVSDEHRFLLRMTHGPFIDVIDTKTSLIRHLAQSDAALLNQIPVDLKAAYMSHDGTMIGVKDSWFNTTRVANPLHQKQIRILKK